MLFSFRSICRFSSSIFLSFDVLPDAEPVVTPLPDDCAVPSEFVPGGETVPLGEPIVPPPVPVVPVLLPAVPVVTPALPVPEPPTLPLCAIA
jgi:hypothetical protein